MGATTVDYLLDLPWYAVSDPDEPTPLYEAVVRDLGCERPWCGAYGDQPCVTRRGAPTRDHAWRQR